MPPKRINRRKKMKRSPKKQKLDNASVDDFLKKGLDNLSDEETDDENEIDDVTPHPNPINHDSSPNKTSLNEASQHKKSLNKLQETDPEFYKFLQENDKDLLNFDDSSSESEEEESTHVAPDRLEVASDDSEQEESGDEISVKKKRSALTVKQINEWREELQQPKPLETITKIINVFKTTVDQMQGEHDEKAKEFKIQGYTAFNGIVRICIMDLVPAFNRLLRAPVGRSKMLNFKPTSAKLWTKLQAHVKCYLMQVIKIMPEVSSPAITKVLLKHALQLVPYFSAFPKTAKTILKKLIHFWSTGEESVRVLALLCIVRLSRKLPDDQLELVYKTMYLAYVRNCKFTSPTTWPLINFMKHSLVEVFALNQTLAYQQAFAYIRQLAIHLRNAITLKKKDSIKTVYNWQFIHCVYLWSHWLGAMHPSKIVQPLIHPLTQIILGTIKLVPSAKYIPLRYHCVRALTTLSRETDTFIPILPFLIEVFEIVNFSKKHNRVSWKPLDFMCALKLSKSQLDENSFKDAVVDQFYELFMDYVSVVSHRIGFPELMFAVTLQMKAFLKQCRISNYNKQIKQLLDKINENSQLITENRKSVSFSIADIKAVENWENQMKQQGTPVLEYYSLYRKMRDKEIALDMSNKEQMDDYDLPTINRKELLQKKKESDRKEFADLFDSDSESDNESRFLLKEEREKSKLNGEDAKLSVDSKQKKIKVLKKNKVKKVASAPTKTIEEEIKTYAEDIVEDLKLISSDENEPEDVTDSEESDISF